MLYEQKNQNAGKFAYFVYHRRDISKCRPKEVGVYRPKFNVPVVNPAS